MKKLISTILAIFTILPVFAKEVSREKAAEFASQHFGGKKAILEWNGLPQKSVKLASTQTKVPFYMFNMEGGGWAIIAADDCMEPIIGYNPNGNLNSNNIPPNMLGWLNNIALNLDKAREYRLEAPAKVKAMWDNTEATVPKLYSASQKLLTTANWSQGKPYNLFCPIDNDGEQSITGCVATAMAIVLRYHEWPEHGHGTLSSYTTRTQEFFVDGYDINDHHYNYGNMPLNDIYSKYWTWSDTQNEEVARLIHDCGVMVRMDYSSTASGAYSEDIGPALAKHMSYKKSYSFLHHSDYSNAQWYEMLKHEIDENRPVLYGGQDIYGGGGHQFVCDGYQNGYIHFNWGWGGSYNGYFSVNRIGPSGQDDTRYAFNYTDAAYFGLEPDRAGTGGEVNEVTSLSLYLWNSDPAGLEIVSGEVGAGKDFGVKFHSAFFNTGNTTYNGPVKLVVADINDNIVEFISGPIGIVGLPSQDVRYHSDIIPCHMEREPLPGDSIMFAYQLPDNSWKLAKAYNNGWNSLYTAIVRYGIMDSYFIGGPQTRNNGDPIFLELICGRHGYSSVTWYYDGEEIPDALVTATPGKHTIKAVINYSNGNKDTVTRKIEVR